MMEEEERGTRRKEKQGGWKDAEERARRKKEQLGGKSNKEEGAGFGALPAGS